MKYDKRVLNSSTTIRSVLLKIDEDKVFSFCVVGDTNFVEGCVSEGDIRRAILDEGAIALDREVVSIVKRDFIQMTPGRRFSAAEREGFLSKGIEFLPVISRDGYLIKIHEITNSDFISVGSRLIGKGHPSFIIAEIGNNHQGSIDTAFKLVDLAVESGVDAVKFQMRNMDEVYGKQRRENVYDLGVEYTLGLLNKFQLSDDELFRAMDYAQEKGLVSFCTPWDVVSARKLVDYGVNLFKVASADMTNFELIDYLASTGIPLIISTGMSEESEIKMLISRLNYFDVDYVLLHCNSTYPAPYDQINLDYMLKLKALGAKNVGYSGHEIGVHIPLAAVAIGAVMIEKHFTLVRDQEGVDHKVSLVPDELTSLVNYVRDLEKAKGGPLARTLTQGEMLNQQVLGKSLYVNRMVCKDELIQRDDIVIRSPGGGFKPYEVDSIVGQRVTRDMQIGSILNHSCFQAGNEERRCYQFDRIYGIPVRYHDYHTLMENVDCPMVEFHLSAKDMYIEPKDVFGESVFNQELVVHTPELFDNDDLLDLASHEGPVRSRSIINVQRTIDLCHKLKKHFNNQDVKLVLNAGGWNVSGFLSKKEKDKKYELVAASLKALNLKGIILCIQTMPPFPWHFGGQSYHNLFVDPREIKEFLSIHGSPNIAVCLDVSHSLMASNYHGFDFYTDIGLYAEHIKHLHISDAEGSTGEGVEFGKGLLDIPRLARECNLHNIDASFIPEVWQGHKDNGAGFWRALKALEGKM